MTFYSFNLYQKLKVFEKKSKLVVWVLASSKYAAFHCWWECKLVQPLQKTKWRFLKKSEIDRSLWLHCPSPQLIQDNLPHFKILNLVTFAKAPLRNKLTNSQGLGCRYLWGTTILPSTSSNILNVFIFSDGGSKRRIIFYLYFF